MEGSYNKVYRAKDRMTRDEFAYLLEKLMRTVRNQIAATIEASYPSLKQQDAGPMLFFKTGETSALIDFAKKVRHEYLLQCALADADARLSGIGSCTLRPTSSPSRHHAEQTEMRRLTGRVCLSSHRGTSWTVALCGACPCGHSSDRRSGSLSSSRRLSNDLRGERR